MVARILGRRLLDLSIAALTICSGIFPAQRKKRPTPTRWLPAVGHVSHDWSGKQKLDKGCSWTPCMHSQINQHTGCLSSTAAVASSTGFLASGQHCAAQCSAGSSCWMEMDLLPPVLNTTDCLQDLGRCSQTGACRTSSGESITGHQH